MSFARLFVSGSVVRGHAFGVVALLSAASAAQERDATGRAHNPGLPGWCETPVADRKAEEGCYTTAITDVGRLPATPVYWHLDVFPTRSAAEAARGPRGTVVDSHGRHWLFTIAEPGWRPKSGIVHAVFGSRRGLLPSVRLFLDFLAKECAEQRRKFELDF